MYPVVEVAKTYVLKKWITGENGHRKEDISIKHIREDRERGGGGGGEKRPASNSPNTNTVSFWAVSFPSLYFPIFCKFF